MGGALVFWIGVLTVGICFGALFMFRSKTDPTLWRTCTILSFASCYLMWGLTYLAQLHPIIVPKRDDLRVEL
ncbi:putative vacuolar ATP synthase subunit E [Kickxella alabastrina]|uniref:H(+)-transporting V0 sector ATPase subunit e n=1 Tax=Kickxella alabastrina TaxID=61397 RepID=A0ACC1I3F4_9FUNG|nr:putative vacuolar ATP synthase subunit E [Kickxella alabastrina]KAI7818905.1 putative vacuolar ATP synthase subunit E [Kickxella alabastrina]KAJ1886538.1 H(+)-transporting V0 sector ATPase subunit e [Kickxella alabastrina]KAJ1939616.1 H(+)-transporting V0 sector ATPase subunit e [Kickxella alabastrina]